MIPLRALVRDDLGSHNRWWFLSLWRIKSRDEPVEVGDDGVHDGVLYVAHISMDVCD